MTTPSLPLKRKSLLFKCLAASLGLHVTALFVLYQCPVLLTSPFGALFDKAPAPEPIFIAKNTPLEKNAILREVFETFSVPTTTIHALFDLDDNFYPFQERPTAQQDVTTLSLFKTSAPSFSAPEGVDIATPSDIAVYEPTLMAQENSALGMVEKKGSIDPKQDLLMPMALLEKNPLAQEILSELPHESLTPREEIAGIVKQPTVVLPQMYIDTTAPQSKPLEKEWVSEQLLPAPFKQASVSSSPSLTKEDMAVFTLPAAQVIDQQFDVMIDVMHLGTDKGGADKGYFFSLTLTPHFDMKLEKIPQLFTFVIDRSASVEKHRFVIFKKGVLKALSYLKEGDFFQICLFDQKVTLFKDKPVAVTKQSLHLAEEFLDKQEQSSSSATNIYASLERIFAKEVETPLTTQQEKLHTAILFTDGKSLQPSKKQQQDIRSWMLKNQGKMAIYTATAGVGNDLPLLNLISTLNCGELMYSDTHAAFPRKLGKLMLNLQQPLATSVIIQAVPTNSGAPITLSTPLFAPIYNNKPYTIQGTVPKLSDFTLFIQGRHQDQWLTMEQSISFGKVREGNKALEKQLALQEASLTFQHFIQSGKGADLEKVNETLKALETKR